MKDENFIHVRLGYEEAIQSKKDILFSEMTLIRILKSVKKFRLLRKEELELKSNLHDKMKEVNIDIRKIQLLLPKPKMPEILKSPHEFKLKKEETKEDTDLENQLREIQERLKSIGG